MGTTNESEASATFHPIGVIHSPHTSADETPIQPVYAADITGRAEVYPDYAEGLCDLEGFSHIWLIYWLHKAPPSCLIVKPFLDETTRGVFATRAPARPNPIGISLVRLAKLEGNVLHSADVDVLDATPLLDIKPYILWFDYRAGAHSGWQENLDEETARARATRHRNPSHATVRNPNAGSGDAW